MEQFQGPGACLVVERIIQEGRDDASQEMGQSCIFVLERYREGSMVNMWIGNIFGEGTLYANSKIRFLSRLYMLCDLRALFFFYGILPHIYCVYIFLWLVSIWPLRTLLALIWYVQFLQSTFWPTCTFKMRMSKSKLWVNNCYPYVPLWDPGFIKF